MPYLKMTKEICEDCGKTEDFCSCLNFLKPQNHNPPSSPHHNRGMLLGDEDKEPEDEETSGTKVHSKSSGSDNQSRFQNHINVIKCATRLRDIDSTRHGSESLNDKINGYDPITQLVVRKDVKEFIQDLKDRINEMDNSSEYEPDVDAKVIIEEIDKLAGKGLTGKPVNLANG